MPSWNVKKYLHRGKKAGSVPVVEQSATRRDSSQLATTKKQSDVQPFELTLQKSLSQDESDLFVKLPLEIREQIYGAVFGNDIRHIVAWRDGQVLGSIRCLGRLVEDAFKIDNPCWGHFWATQVRESTCFANQNMSLILTCRRVYLEAIKVLYLTTRFVFTGPDIVGYFTTKVPGDLQRHVAFIEITAPSIYALTLRSTDGIDGVNHEYYHQWTTCIDKLSQLQALRTLFVVVPNSKPHEQWRHTAKDERKLLEPLVQLTQVKQLVVALAWFGGSGGSEGIDHEATRYSFQLHRFDHLQHLPREKLKG